MGVVEMVVWAIAALACGLIGLWFGYDIGVEETERRWSEAVARVESRKLDR